MNLPMLKFNLSGHVAAGFETSDLVGVSFSPYAAELETEIRNVVTALPFRDRLLAGEKACVLLPSLESGRRSLVG